MAVLYFGGNLVPALGFFDLYFMRYAYVADHFQYVASIGLITLATASVTRLLRVRLGWGRNWTHAVLYVVAGSSIAARVAVLAGGGAHTRHAIPHAHLRQSG